jgi:uncharacterized protein YbgA (DUF1722 family)
MAVVEIALTGEQLAVAYTQLSQQERRSFLSLVLSQPTHRQAALDLLAEAQSVLSQKFSPRKQRQLDRLLDKNAAGALTATERTQLAELIDEYGAGLVEKARAKYVLELAEQAATPKRKPHK